MIPELPKIGDKHNFHFDDVTVECVVTAVHPKQDGSVDVSYKRKEVTKDGFLYRPCDVSPETILALWDKHKPG